jgi:hypothetical protein
MKNRNLTYGEALVESLLFRLPEEHYYYVVQPRFFDSYGRDHKPDFVVISREFGLLVIEVKDWVDLRGGNQDEIIIVRRDGTEVTEPNPMGIADEYAYQIVQQCMKRRELTQRFRSKTKLAFPWQVMIVLPNISRDRIKEFERVGVWSSRVVIGKEPLENAKKFETTIRNLPWRWELPQRMDDSTYEIVRGVINPQLVVMNAQGEDIGTLTPQQEALIQEPLISEELSDPLSSEAREVVQSMNVRLIRGAAGSGKTLVLANRAEFLARNYPNQRLLVITFNRDLADALNNRLSQHKIDVKTYNEICYTLLQPTDKWSDPIEVTGWLEQHLMNEIQATGLSLEYIRQEIRWRKEMNLYDDQQYLEVHRKGRGQALGREKRLIINKIFNQYTGYQNTLKRQGMNWRDWDDLHELARLEIRNGRNPLAETADVILIDEAQDFAPSWFDVIKRLLKPNGSLFICDDPTQSIYQAFSWMEKGIDVRGRSRILRVPFRSTRAIMRAAYNLIIADPILSTAEEIIEPDIDSDELIEGEKPELVDCGVLEDEIAYVEARIEALIESGVQPRAIAVLCHSRRALKGWSGLQQRHKEVFVAHFERMKGLDFDIVFIPHLNNMFKNVTDASGIAEVRRRLYVGMTRARDGLVLTYHGALPDAMKPIQKFVKSE